MIGNLWKVLCTMRCLLDTNIFVEAFKGQKEAQNLLDFLVENSDRIEIYIPYNVVEETIFLLIKRTKNTGYWKLKKDKSLVIESFKEIKPYLEFVFALCDVLFPTKKVMFESLNHIENYGLLPNDALVLAFCKVHKIDVLISLDSDFKEAVKEEGITLISSFEELKGLFADPAK